MFRYVVSAIAFLAVVILGLSSGGKLPKYLDIPSVGLLMVCTFGMTLVSHTLREMKEAFVNAFEGSENRSDLLAALYFWKSVIRNFLVAGCLGSLIGAISIVANLSNPKDLGPATGMCMLTTLYAGLFACILPLPAIYTIKQSLAVSSPKTSESGSVTRPSIAQILAGYILYVGTILVTIWLGGCSLLHFADASALLIVLGGTFAIGVVAAKAGKGNLESRLYGWQLVSAAFFVLALAGSAAGFIGMVSTLVDPARIGPAMAIVALSPFYGLFGASLISFPMEDRTCKALGRYETFSFSQAVWHGLPILTLFWLIASLLTLMSSLTN